SGHGVEIFDPATGQFTHYSRDLDLRVGSLAFAADGTLWATTWPDRTQVVRFTVHARAEAILTFDTPIDSLAFGQPGTDLHDLLFVTHNSGPGGSELTMVDVVTRRKGAVARGGSRGDNVITTSDGRVLISQSTQVDVLFPVRIPVVVATNPADHTTAALPLGLVTVTFDQDMFVGAATDPASVVNRDNYGVVDAHGTHATVRSVTYDRSKRTALLSVEGLVPGAWTLVVSDQIKSAAGYALAGSYVVTFTTVSDFAADVSVRFTDTRLDRAEQTVTY